MRTIEQLKEAFVDLKIKPTGCLDHYVGFLCRARSILKNKRPATQGIFF
jgi:hypothetical protein